MKEQLIEQAIKMRDRAIAPYSDYKVGSAVLTKSDKPIPDDCNYLLMREANKYTKKKLNKQFKKTTTIKIKAGN